MPSNPAGGASRNSSDCNRDINYAVSGLSSTVKLGDAAAGSAPLGLWSWDSLALPSGTAM
eukprot:14837331-Heterocapsa_arctica.AAC.1